MRSKSYDRKIGKYQTHWSNPNTQKKIVIWPTIESKGSHNDDYVNNGGCCVLPQQSLEEFIGKMKHFYEQSKCKNESQQGWKGKDKDKGKGKWKPKRKKPQNAEEK